MADVPYSEITELTFDAPTKTLSYGDISLQQADYWSQDEDATLIVLIHGGCWLNHFGKAHVRPLASKLHQAGYAVMSIEYRRIGDAGGGWPGTFNDMTSALNFAQDLPHPSFVTLGHSAGGHLALWAAAQTSHSKFVGAIGLAAISDLETYATGSSSCQKATPKLMGGTPKQLPQRYALASPLNLNYAHPTYLLHGTQDSIVPLAQSRNFCDQQADCSLFELKNKGHFDLIDPRQDVTQHISTKIKQWLTRE